MRLGRDRRRRRRRSNEASGLARNVTTLGISYGWPLAADRHATADNLGDRIIGGVHIRVGGTGPSGSGKL